MAIIKGNKDQLIDELGIPKEFIKVGHMLTSPNKTDDGIVFLMFSDDKEPPLYRHELKLESAKQFVKLITNEIKKLEGNKKSVKKSTKKS